MRRLIIVGLVLLAFGGLPAGAWAQATEDCSIREEVLVPTYGGVQGEVLYTDRPCDPPGHPDTGMDLGLVGMAGAMLIGLGVAMRRAR